MKFTKDYRYYDIQISNTRYRIVARSIKEARNTARFKFCYMRCLQHVSHYSMIDRIDLKQQIKEFDFALITSIIEGVIVEAGQLSMNKRQSLKQWKMIRELHQEMLIEDMRRHEIEIGGME